jgi:hypothetical protein
VLEVLLLSTLVDKAPMPFETSFDRPRRLMITRAWGDITLTDLRAYQLEIGQRPEFDPTWRTVCRTPPNRFSVTDSSGCAITMAG